MKKNFFSILIISSLVTFSSFLSFATNPEISKWIKNISEGEGAPAIGMDDYGPEIVSSGKTIHILWMTNNNWITKDLYYRRSPDGGKTWEPKMLVASSSGLNDVVRSPKMYAFGNYVHIAYIIKQPGSGPSELTYLRSSNSGQHFDAPEILYSVPQDMTELKVKGDGPRLTIAAIHNCWYCGTINIIHLFSSENNGDTFVDNVVDGNFNGYEFICWDVAREGNHVYLLILEPVGNWYDYNYNLHLFSSGDRGTTFKDNIISVPAMSGLHHPYFLMDYAWGYTRKMATEGDKVWVIWSGLNAQNQEKIFVSGSQDGGNTFSVAKEISGDLVSFKYGQESITISGDEIYTCFLRLDGKIYVAKSHDGGNNFDPAYEFTLPNDIQLQSGWGPLLLNDPLTHNSHLFRTGPVHGILTPQNDYPVQQALGNATIKDQRNVAAVFDDEGFLHIAFQGGRAWLSTGVFTDYEIYYRRVDPAFTPASQEDQSLVMSAKINPGDGSGESRFDKMVIAPTPDLKFTDQMTIELWLKPEVDRPATYLTQNHYLSGNQGQVNGFILWSDGYQGLLPVTNMVTESGLYPMSSSRKMQLNTWNHLAITYDKDGGAQNFRMYLNGQLVAATNALGNILSPDVSWILGAFKDSYYRDSFEGQMDELRFWNVVRNQEQISQGLYQKLNGNEPGLVAYYNFNEISPEGQIADLTGKGHTGYLVYKEENKPSTLKDIHARFEYVQSGSSFYFTQKTIGGEHFEWSFGDTHTSAEVNPKHTYLTPGIFQVCMTATGQENAGTYCETVIVEGIDRVFPTSGGNTGGITLNIFGGGFSTNSQAILRKAGETDIHALKNIFDDIGSVTAVFDLHGAIIGDWDVVIKTGVSELVLPKGFKIIIGGKAQPWVKYIGGGTLLVNRWTPQTIVVGNSGNVDAYGVVLWVAVPNTQDFDMLFLNLNVKKPQVAIDKGWSEQLESIGLSQVVDSLFGKPSDSRLYSFYLPYLPAGSTLNISTRVRTKTPVQQGIQVAVSAPFYASPLSPNVQACIAFSIAKAFLKAGIGAIPGIPCITGELGLILDYTGDNPPTPSSFPNIDVRCLGWTVGTTLLECAASFGGPLVGGVLSLITASVEAKQETDDCLRGFWPSPFSLFQIAYYGVSSLDPNEKIGPAGYGDENFIPVTGQLSYQINFENKSSATAPAQEVMITDTLDKALYNLSDFSFGPVAFGDEVFYPVSNTLEFGIETDLRPLKNIIVRMTGQLDTLTRVITWQFRALDPETRDLVSDPLGGFLPPNLVSPEGEGYVTFSVGLKEVKHMDALSNRASIVFDLNPPIITNTFVNTFDMKAPESFLTMDDPVSTETTFTIHTNGSDDGCGIRMFEIYVSTNHQPFELDRYSSSETFEFTGAYGSSYRFYSIAVDSVGNIEAAPVVPDIEVSVVTGVTDLTNWKEVKVYPNPSGHSRYIDFMLREKGVVHCGLYDLYGREVLTFFELSLSEGLHHFEIKTAVPNGMYLLKLDSGHNIYFRQIAVVK